MVFVKKLVMKGFKSFAKETEVPFTNSMNVIVGPNGSGKSNITDAICFVLGRLSVKSMRAAKSTHLIFAGTKEYKPSHEASVTIVFDNTDNKFSINKNEVAIQRIVRSNGQGIYKINEEVKTRQEVLELLALAGIDPYGFNIVLQGEISSVVKMNGEERRKVLEEVAGISIYELRKEKSLKEMEKTEEKLKEVQSILRERTSYLRNLEEERKQALKFKKLEEMVKKCKASILKKKIDEKKKEISHLEEKFHEKEKYKADIKEKMQKIETKLFELEAEISQINSTIQKASGIEQESLNNEISNLRANLVGLSVRKENNESRIKDILSRRAKMSEDVKKFDEEISRLKKEFPSQAKKHQELENKKKEFEFLEKERKAYLASKERANALKQICEDKQKQLDKNKNNVSFILDESNRLANDLIHKEVDSCRKEIQRLKQEQESTIKSIEKKEKEIIEKDKNISLASQEINNAEKIKKDVSKLDICPLCKSKITAEHIKEVYNDCDDKIVFYQDRIKALDTAKDRQEIVSLRNVIASIKIKLNKAELDLIKLVNIEDKKEQLKNLHAEKLEIENDLINLEKEKKSVESKMQGLDSIEEKYDRVFLEIREISSRTQDNLNAELEFKAQDLEKLKIQLKQSERDETAFKDELIEIKKEIEKNESLLNKKGKDEQELEARFNKLIEKKTGLEKLAHEQNTSIFEFKSKLAVADSEINNFKLEKARLDAEHENLNTDFSAYADVEILSMSIQSLEEKLAESQQEMQIVGNVNLRALEVYDKMKQEYEEISKKAETLENEKNEIIKIIEEIDKKKKKTFTRTLEAVNQLFDRNFTQLSSKGNVSLELENQEDPFAAGMDIIVKVGKGKYFDVTSLSGGEQTLVALSLIFAIQEYKPYAFYIFDEVDAALDKRNSERLAGLVKKYMKTGQYIIVTHNDALITESTTLYGVSMQEGVSKVLSLPI
jgi:chromosome segregation protein